MTSPAAEAAQLVCLLEQIHAGGRYARIQVRRPWSEKLESDEDQITEPGGLRVFLLRELGRLLGKGATITVSPGDPRLSLDDPAFRSGGALNRDARLDRKQLFLFSAERIALSAARVAYYTGTPAAGFQSVVLYTNFWQHVDAFRRLFPTAVGPDNQRRQMPAWHYQQPGGTGISLVHIGVGAPSAMNIAEQIAAAVRPLLNLLIGHCGGIRSSQQAGDLVVPHSYIRHDGVLDKVLDLDIPVMPELPVLAVIQDVVREEGVPDGRWRIGRVLTTADRNWDWSDVDDPGSRLARLLRDGRVIAVEMEGAALAGCFQLYRQLAAALLVVSDQPLNHKPKLDGPARALFEASCEPHIRLAAAVADRFRKLHPEGIDL